MTRLGAPGNNHGELLSGGDAEPGMFGVLEVAVLHNQPFERCRGCRLRVSERVRASGCLVRFWGRRPLKDRGLNHEKSLCSKSEAISSGDPSSPAKPGSLTPSLDQGIWQRLRSPKDGSLQDLAQRP